MRLASEQHLDVCDAGLDPDELGAALLEQVAAPGAEAVHLDRQPAEVADPGLARGDKRGALAAQEAEVRAAGERCLGCGSGPASTSEERHFPPSLTASGAS